MTEHNNLDSNHSQQVKMVTVYASSSVALRPVYCDALSKNGKVYGVVPGFYDRLLQFLRHSIDECFMGSRHLKMWSVVNEPEQVLEAIESSHAWGCDALQYANVTSANA